LRISWDIKERISIANNRKHSVKLKNNAEESKNGGYQDFLVSKTYQSKTYFASVFEPWRQKEKIAGESRKTRSAKSRHEDYYGCHFTTLTERQRFRASFRLSASNKKRQRLIAS
jgi:hypothetical protein